MLETVVWVFIGSMILLTFAAIIKNLPQHEPLEVKRKRLLDEESNKLDNNFKVSQEFTTPTVNSGISIDEENKQIKVFQFIDEIPKVAIVPFNKVMASEVAFDNETMVTTSRGSQLKGLVVGGILAGGLGALIGGVTGNKINKESYYSIDLTIKVDDLNSPIHRVNFLDTTDPISEKKKALSKDDTRVIEAVKNIDHWNAVIEIIMKRESENQIKASS